MVEQTIEDIPLWMIVPAEVQPRDEVFDGDALVELAQSIVSVGLIQPVVVMPVEDEDGYTTAYELVAGERRVRAAAAIALWMSFPNHEFEDYVRRLAVMGMRGLNEAERTALKERNAGINGIIRNPADRETLQLATLAENIARKSLSPIEEARAFRGLMDRRRWSQRDLAMQIGMSQGYISQHLGLLDLPPATQEAVSTRVITIAHTREIASLPEYAQEVGSEFVAKWAAAGETTRTISERVKAVRNMLDPQRWTPNPAQFYEQGCRNYLGIIEAVARQANAETAQALFEATEGKYCDDMARSPKQVGENSYYAGRALEMMGIKKPAFAELAKTLNEDSCENCQFNGIRPYSDDAVCGYCIKWLRGNNGEDWCSGHIGIDDPVLIPLDCYTSQKAPEDKIVTHGGRRYVESVDVYMDAYNAFLVERDGEHKKRNEDEDTIAEIREYCDWVESLPQATQWHFQAHACTKCQNYVLDNNPDGPPLRKIRYCRFSEEMLRHGNGTFHAPRFAMLVSKDGMTIPRCEMFRCSEDNITIAKPENFRSMLFGIGLQTALDWMRQMYGKDGHSHFATGDTICGCLNWLPYPHDNGTDWENLFTYIHIKGELLGGDRGRAVLIDSVMYEGRAMQSSREAFPLLNVETGDVEVWMPAPFPLTKYFCKEAWPKNWFKPWEEEAENV
ncbi:MAG: ParB N-terminal domain-containing protein [Anaerolineae bacterium]|nr:ParB N-terminal domain-containing protein [Anaerolineae bacterium]